MDQRPSFISTREAGALLGVTVQQVRRLAQAGAINRVARGLIDRPSVERYLASGRGGRTRVWAEPTAWGAIALLSGRPAEWLTSAQTSRVRTALRAMDDPRELAARLRGRATVTTYGGDSTAESVIRERLYNPDGLGPLLDGTRPGHLDGYIAADELRRIVRILEMCPDPDGTITLRSTSFDMARVRRLNESPVLAACDEAISPDRRRHADAECSLGVALEVVAR